MTAEGMVEEQRDPVAVAVGAAIRELRNAAGLTQEQLGERVPMDQSLLSRYEGGRAFPPLQTMWAIEAALGVPRGQIQRRAGLIDEAVSTRDWLARDGTLDPESRRFMLAAYEYAVGRSVLPPPPGRGRPRKKA